MNDETPTPASAPEQSYQVTVGANLRVYTTVDVRAASPEAAEQEALNAIENNLVDFTWTNENGKSLSGNPTDLEIVSSEPRPDEDDADDADDF